MRISDWSSDVCSSDVTHLDLRTGAFKIVGGEAGSPVRQDMGDEERERLSGGVEEGDGVGGILRVVDGEMDEPGAAIEGDRKRVVEGRSGSGRVDLGGRRRLKKIKS